MVKEAQPKKEIFSVGDKVVYPSHGVGAIESVESHEISGHTLQVYVIYFEQDRMTLRLPVAKANDSGLRSLSSKKRMEEALKTLKTKGKIKRTMWSRRAQEYETKINSGDPESIAEVVRDLHRSAAQPEQSYSERQLYQAAMDRLCRELSAVETVEETKALDKINRALKKAHSAE